MNIVSKLVVDYVVVLSGCCTIFPNFLNSRRAEKEVKYSNQTSHLITHDKEGDQGLLNELLNNFLILDV